MNYEKTLNIISKVLEINKYGLELDDIILFLDTYYNGCVETQKKIISIQEEKDKFSHNLSKIYELRLEEEKCFTDISGSSALSEDYMRKYRNNLNWVIISKEQRLSEDFIREHKDKVHWKNITRYQCLSEEFIFEFEDKVDWIYIARNICSGKIIFSEKLVKKINSIVPNLIDWNKISNEKLSEDFVREFQDKVSWRNIFLTGEFTDEFIDEFSDKVPWSYISQKRSPSIKLYSKYRSRVNWASIYNHVLSEDFMRHFQTEIHWDKISQKQKIPEDLIIEFSDKLMDWLNILRYQKLSENFLRQLYRKFTQNIPFISSYHMIGLSEEKYRKYVFRDFWSIISMYQKLSEDFIREFQDEVCWKSIYDFQILSKEFYDEFKIQDIVLFDIYALSIYCDKERYLYLVINKIKNSDFEYLRITQCVKRIQRNFREKIYRPEHIFVLRTNLHFIDLQNM